MDTCCGLSPIANKEPPNGATQGRYWCYGSAGEWRSGQRCVNVTSLTHNEKMRNAILYTKNMLDLASRFTKKRIQQMVTRVWTTVEAMRNG